MTFDRKLAQLPSPREVARRLAAVTPEEVRRTLDGARVRPQQAPVLFSAAARPQLERMAARAREVTLRRFGRTITLYAPIYLSNHCVNHCAYCGFAASRSIARRSLTAEEAEAEAAVLIEQGVRHLLLVTGEAPREYGLARIAEVARCLRCRLEHRVASISVEVFPCDRPGYRELIRAGVDGLVLYQETYDRERYLRLHPAGPKRSFEGRLAAIEAGGEVGFRSLGIGSLLGLAPHRVEACYLAWHAEHLTRRFPRSRLAISFPRLRPVPGHEPVQRHRVSDADLVQMIVGMRLLFPDAELVLSTREPARLRDHLIHLGITRMSAGSRTSPGAYAAGVDDAGRQFETDDRRQVAEVMQMIRSAGYDVVTKDFDPAFVAVPEEEGCDHEQRAR